jgi:hypothetical protein
MRSVLAGQRTRTLEAAIQMKDVVIPPRMQGLRRDAKGRPVPYFVQIPPDGGEPDFRIMDYAAKVDCYRFDLCWVCGGKLGVHKAFVLGPMCVINRVNAEPPSHYECAHYSVQACPFLSTPRMSRRERDLPEDAGAPDGLALYHNPGAAAIWVCRNYHAFKDGGGGWMFRVGDPERVEWYAEGEPASRTQVLDAIGRGFPTLLKFAEEEGPKAVQHLEQDYAKMMALLPQEEPCPPTPVTI